MDVVGSQEWAALRLLCLFYRRAFKEMSKLRFECIAAKAPPSIHSAVVLSFRAHSLEATVSPGSSFLCCDTAKSEIVNSVAGSCRSIVCRV